MDDVVGVGQVNKPASCPVTRQVSSSTTLLLSLLLLDFIPLFWSVIPIGSALGWLQAGLGHGNACGVVSGVAL